jgi:hypothetical protein
VPKADISRLTCRNVHRFHARSLDILLNCMASPGRNVQPRSLQMLRSLTVSLHQSCKWQAILNLIDRKPRERNGPVA